MLFTNGDIIYSLFFPLNRRRYSERSSPSCAAGDCLPDTRLSLLTPRLIIRIPNDIALLVGQLIWRAEMVIMIMIQLNAGFDDGFVIAVPAFLIFLIAFRFIIGCGQSISYPDKLSNRLKAVLLIDDGMGVSIGMFTYSSTKGIVVISGGYVGIKKLSVLLSSLCLSKYQSSSMKVSLFR